MVQRVHSETLRSTAAPATVVSPSDRNARIINAVADAWADLQAERDWRWMRETLDVALTIGQQTYTGTALGATRFGRWRKEDLDYQPIIYKTGTPNALWHLDYWQLDQFRYQYLYRTWGNSTPLGWTFDESNQLIIGPAPAVAYNIRIEQWKEPSALSADADTPDMPSRFHLVLVWKALQAVARQDAAPEILSHAETMHTEIYSRLLRDQARLAHL